MTIKETLSTMIGKLTAQTASTVPHMRNAVPGTGRVARTMAGFDEWVCNSNTNEFRALAALSWEGSAGAGNVIHWLERHGYVDMGRGQALPQYANLRQLPPMEQCDAIDTGLRDHGFDAEVEPYIISKPKVEQLRRDVALLLAHSSPDCVRSLVSTLTEALTCTRLHINAKTGGPYNRLRWLRPEHTHWQCTRFADLGGQYCFEDTHVQGYPDFFSSDAATWHLMLGHFFVTGRPLNYTAPLLALALFDTALSETQRTVELAVHLGRHCAYRPRIFWSQSAMELRDLQAPKLGVVMSMPVAPFYAGMRQLYTERCKQLPNHVMTGPQRHRFFCHAAVLVLQEMARYHACVGRAQASADPERMAFFQPEGDGKTESPVAFMPWPRAPTLADRGSWSSPEQAAHMPTDQQSDLFTAGLILLELARTGMGIQRPLRAEHLHESTGDPQAQQRAATLLKERWYHCFEQARQGAGRALAWQSEGLCGAYRKAQSALKQLDGITTAGNAASPSFAHLVRQMLDQAPQKRGDWNAMLDAFKAGAEDEATAWLDCKVTLHPDDQQKHRHVIEAIQFWNSSTFPGA